MVSADPRSGNAFDQLLNAMPRISEAVNAFASEEAQRIALTALVRAVGMSDEPTVDRAKLSVAPTVAGDQHDRGVRAAETKSVARTRKPTSKKSWARVKDIDFRPAGKPSLREFAAEKEPASFDEKNLVLVYYLQEYLAVASIEVGHVLAAYEECEWKSPSIPDNSLMVTASKRGWLETSDMKAIKITLRGRNVVQYDIPAKKAKKSA